MRKIILASASPRRKELLKQIGLKFTTEPSQFEEEIKPGMKPEKLVKQLSLKKCQIVASRHTNAIVISADTLVVLEGKILGKPRTSENARRMLRSLSGKTHSVITGFTIIDAQSSQSVTRVIKTKVYLKRMEKKEIKAYVKTGEPLDKAGAYGIQELGGIFVEKIEGDYFNVVGLPLFALAEELEKFGIKILA